VVRLGRRRGVVLYLALSALALGVVLAGVILRAFPVFCLAALLSVPLLVKSGRIGLRTFEHPREFLPAVRSIVACYVVAAGLFTAGVMASRLL